MESSAAPAGKGDKAGGIGMALMLPATFVVAWILSLTNTQAPGAVAGEASDVNSLRWMFFFTGIIFLVSSFMHSVLAKKTAASIGWTTNGFQYEIAFVSLGAGLACLYAGQNGKEAWIAAALPTITFLFLAGVNHLIEIIRVKNYAPNNTLILIWDFGIPISLVALLLSTGSI
ncbi:MAG: hypothetical protein FGM34_06075 [Solirubrobacteraceae bacterium]|nr:hypothetical protein [Solirubrobacteraceae bacterium]